MRPIASSNISRRSSGEGHLAPSTCSFRFSPVPTPRKKRPGIRQATVAAACATIAGWMRIVGHVTPVPIRNTSVRSPIAPSTEAEYVKSELWAPAGLVPTAEERQKQKELASSGSGS